MQVNTVVPILAWAAFLAALAPAYSQSPEANSLQKKLEDQYAMTKLTADHTNIVTTGAVLVLKKDGLVMASSNAGDVAGNTYKDGKIIQNAAGKANEKVKKIGNVFHKIPVVGGASGPPSAPVETRTFVAGEKLYVTKIDVKTDNSVAIELYSVEAYSDNYYHTTLAFPVAKNGESPSADKVVSTVAEVFKVAEEAADAQKTADSNPNQAARSSGAPAPSAPPSPAPSASPSTPPAAQAPMTDDPPPPPPPVEVKPISTGDTKDSVVARYGQPDSVGQQTNKEIYVYKKLGVKVTFVNGKVTDIQ